MGTKIQRIPECTRIDACTEEHWRREDLSAELVVCELVLHAEGSEKACTPAMTPSASYDGIADSERNSMTGYVCMTEQDDVPIPSVT